MSDDVLAPGSRVGPYQVARILGRGGTGVVYEATGPAGRVALKLLASGAASDPELVERARREARVLGGLAHPSIVRVEGAGEHRGLPWVALELLPGGTLADRLRARGRLPWREVCAIGAELARALAHVHAKGLVHRDVKPANVFVAGDGRLRLGDFGLVRRSAAPGTSVAITRSGESLGTPAFLAPEQVDGAREAGPAADLYGLGATLSTLITGVVPFEGLTGPALLYAKLQKAPRPVRELVPGIPEDVARAIERLLEREPAARGASALDVAAELEALARQPEDAGASRLPARLFAVALVVGALVVGAWPRTRDAGPQPTRPTPPSPSASPSVTPGVSPLPTSSSSPRASPTARRARSETDRRAAINKVTKGKGLLRSSAREALDQARLAHQLDETNAEAYLLEARALKALAPAPPEVLRANLLAAIAALQIGLALDPAPEEPTPDSEPLRLGSEFGKNTVTLDLLHELAMSYWLLTDERSGFDSRRVEAAFEQAVKLEPRFVKASMDWAQLELNLDRPDEATRILRHAIEFAGRDVGLWSKLAEARRMAGDPAGAVDAATRALVITPDYGPAIRSRAYTPTSKRGS